MRSSHSLLVRRLVAGFAAAGALLGGLGAEAAPRTVLAELFGAMACPDCGAARAALTTLQSELGDGLAWVEYHSAAPLGHSGADARAAYYGVTSSPTVRIDGTGAQVGGSDYPAEYRDRIETARTLPAPLLVDGLFFFEVESGLGSVIVTVSAAPGEAIPDPADIVVRVLVVETPVSACCGTGGTDTWPRVVRRVLSPEPLLVASPGETQSFERMFSLDGAWNADQLAGVIFVQRNTDQSVLAAAEGRVSSSLAPLPTQLDDPSRVNLFPSFPNPMRTTARIDFFLPQADDAKLRIVNANGQVVRVLTDGPRTQGFHPLSWDGTDYTGRRMASGVYVYVLETSTVIVSKRLTLLR